MNAFKKAALLCALFLISLSASAQTAVSGTKVQDGTGTGSLLFSGQWCFGGTCETVSGGAFSGTVTPGTATVTVVNASSNTILTVPGVTVGAIAFSWDNYTVPTSVGISGTGLPLIACSLGAIYTQTDSVPANAQSGCQDVFGNLVWVPGARPPSPSNVANAVASENPVLSTATPVFSNLSNSTYMVMSQNVTSWTVVSGLPGQQLSILFCEDSAGGHTLAGTPANVSNWPGLTSTSANACTKADMTYNSSVQKWVVGSAPTAALPSNAIPFTNGSGVTSAATAGNIAPILGAASGCSTAGTVYSPSGNNCVSPSGSGASLSTANTFTQPNTFPKILATQTGPANSGGWSAFGAGSQTNSALAGGLTVLDDGTANSFGLASYGAAGAFGVALYTATTSAAAKPIWICPSALSGTYPTAVTSFNCPYEFQSTGITSSQPVTVSGSSATNNMTAPKFKVGLSGNTWANSGAFSAFGGSQNNAALAGGITVADDGSTLSFGLANYGTGSAFGPALYSITTAANVKPIWICPAIPSGTYPTVMSNFNCVVEYTSTGLTQSIPITVTGSSNFVTAPQLVANLATPSSSANWSHFGPATHSTTALQGGLTLFDNGTTESEGLADYSLSGSQFGVALYTATSSSLNRSIWICPSASGGTYPVNQASFNCPYIFQSSSFGGAIFSSPLTMASNLTIGGTGNGTSFNTLAYGPVTINPQSDTVHGAGSLVTSDPLVPSQAATRFSARTEAEILNVLPVSNPVTYSATVIWHGDSITCGQGAVNSSCSTSGYAYQVSTALGATTTMHAIQGDQACDQANSVFTNESPAATSQWYAEMIGTNDIRRVLPAGNEQNYAACLGASISRMAIPNANTVAGNTCTQTTGTWTNDTSYTDMTGAQASTLGNVLTCTITTNGGPIYLWYRAIDSNAGTFTYQLDSGTAVSLNSFGVVPIQTANGGTYGAFLQRITGVSAGSHTIKVTITSATGAGNIVSIIGVGTTPTNSYYAGPVVGIGTVIKEEFDGNGPSTSEYSRDAMDTARLFMADGLDVRLIDPPNCLQNGSTTQMTDQFHPNLTGHTALVPCWTSVMALPPAHYVRRGTPASDTAACTAGDVWADASFFYSCVKSGQVVRAAITTGSF